MSQGIIFKVSLKPGFRDILGRFRRAGSRLRKDQVSELHLLGESLKRFVTQEAPSRTGEFAASHDVQIRPYAGRIEVYAPQPMSNWIRFGVDQPYPIPTNWYPGRPPLSFFWEKKGEHVVFAHVTHPAMAPNPYLKRAFDRWLPEAKRGLMRLARGFVAEVMS